MKGSGNPRGLLALLGLAFVAWLAWWSFRDVVPEAELNGVAPGVAAAAAEPASPTDGAASSIGTATDPGEEADSPRRAAGDVVDGEAALEEDGPTLVVRVVAAEDEAPLPGAEVFLVDPEAIDPQVLERTMAEKGDLEALFRDHGERRVADARGIALFPRPMGDEFVLAGVAPGRFDVGFGFEEGSEEVTLTLGRRNVLPVRVVDQDGRPQAGLKVVLRRRFGAGSFGLLEVASDEDGLAAFQLPSRLVEEETSDDEGYAVGLATVGGDPVEAEVDLRDLPSEPVQLVVPADTGAVEVAVRGEAGAASSDPVMVGLSVRSEEGDAEVGFRWRPDAAQALLGEEGSVVFPLVRVGTPLHVEAVGGGGELRAEADGVGPAAPGATVRFELVLRRERPALVGRLLNEEGRPGKGVLLRAELVTRSSHSHSTVHESLRCDSEGRFRFVLREPYPGGGTRTLRLVVSARRGKPERDVVVDLSRPYPPGDHDLGDLVVTAPPLVAAGRVLGPDGETVGGSRVRVEVLLESAGAGSSEVWRGSAAQAVSTDADGAFALHARLDPARRYRLVAAHPEYLDETQEFALGAEGVVVRLRPAMRLAGRILLPDGIEPAWVTLEYAPVQTDDRRSSLPIRVEDDGAFAETGLPPGGGELVVRARHTEEELTRRSIPADFGGEVVVDLRGTPLTTLTLHVRRADGRPLGYWSVGAPGGHGPTSYLDDPDPTLVTRGSAFDLVLAADDAREVRLTGVAGERTVEFRSGLEVGLRAEPTVDLPDDWQLQLTLDDSGDPPSGMGEFVGQVVLDDSGYGVATLRRAGRFQVSVGLRRTVRGPAGSMVRSYAVGNAGRLEVRDVVGRQEFTVPIDPELVRRALERVEE